jgi:hypothetical protein
MDPVDAERLLERSVREHVPEIEPTRAVLVVAIARWLSEQVLIDAHLADSEREQIRRGVGPDLQPEELAWVLEALERHRSKLSLLRPHYWMSPLVEWLTGHRRISEPYQFLQHTLPSRWPMLPDSARAVVTQHLEAGPRGIQIGEPRAMSSLHLPWHELMTIEPVQPWPELLIEWQEAGRLRRSRVAPSKDRDAFEAAVEALFEAAEARVPTSKLPTGWLAAPHAAWQDVDALPTDHAPERGADYRSAPQTRDAVVAVRPPRGGLHVLMQWLASSPDRPFRAMLREAVLTERHLYARRQDGKVQRLPLDLLEEKIGGSDAIYRFGRGNRVLLSDAERCPVCQGLDARLAAHGR